MTDASKHHDTMYSGSCHCNFITYTVGLNLSTPDPHHKAIITKCNCTICHKSGNLLTQPEPGSLKVLTPPNWREVIGDYTFGEKRIHHYFCPHCGVRPFLEGEVEMGGEKIPVQRLNMLSIDGRLDGKDMVELKNIKVKYFAGRDVEWTRGLGDEPYEGGTW
ncbi:hypothetical protein E6O75_ATG06242 [Venturia nashicola]|uniref:CENP-V/GFA domain-containing protein n=1 Tax=Venturia nashicola TaxID=86259 RepID=A0A4Z1PC13_9PEZI|nr:hypothetical protein E6O75_ATG06242 [Venturia nashicola]